MSDDILSGGSSKNTGGRGSELPEGYYSELRLVKAKLERKQKLNNARCFIATFEVINATNGVESGALGDCFEQLELTKFESHAVEARGRTMQLVGSLFGFSTTAEIDQNVNGKTLEMVCSDLQPMTGTVVSVYVKHIVREGKTTITRFEGVKPVIDAATGKNKVVRPGVAKGPVAQAPVTATAPAAPPPPPAPAAPAQPAIPAGWLIHPQNSAWAYNPTNPSEMKQVG